MKKFIGLFLVLATLFALNSCDSVAEHSEKVNVDLNQEKLVVSQILDNLAAATESGNFEMIKEIWSPSEESLLIGTDSDQKFMGWEDIMAAIKKQFGSFEQTFISITDQSIWINEDASMAWFFEELNYNFVFEEKAMTFEGIRFTGVMRRIDGKWRLVQQHMSIPAEPEMVATN